MMCCLMLVCGDSLCFERERELDWDGLSNSWFSLRYFVGNVFRLNFKTQDEQLQQMISEQIRGEDD